MKRKVVVRWICLRQLRDMQTMQEARAQSSRSDRPDWRLFSRWWKGRKVKIVKSIRDIYLDQTVRGRRLSLEVNELLKAEVEGRGWFFESRLKEEDSFALKLETGRVVDPTRLEDFYGCMIVVANLNHVDDAERLVSRLFDLVERRPANDGLTKKVASDFRFDDLRLYVTRRESASGANPELVGVMFEIQIKTILQYAWGKATHDLTYKTEDVSWATERIGFQIRAMLEHVEVSLAAFQPLSAVAAVAKRDDRTIRILEVIQQLKKVWTRDRLPEDLKRQAINIFELLEGCHIDVAELAVVVGSERRRLGLLPQDLSP